MAAALGTIETQFLAYMQMRGHELLRDGIGGVPEGNDAGDAQAASLVGQAGIGHSCRTRPILSDMGHLGHLWAIFRSWFAPAGWAVFGPFPGDLVAGAAPGTGPYQHSLSHQFFQVPFRGGPGGSRDFKIAGGGQSLLHSRRQDHLLLTLTEA